ncbi:hypothetical protein D3C81_1452700 [compost metagenome]
MNVHADRDQQHAFRRGQLGVRFGAFLQLVCLGRIALVLVALAHLAVGERDHRAVVAVRRGVFSLEFLLHQHFESRAVERGIQLIEDVTRDSPKLGGSLPTAVLEVGVLLVVVPDLAAMRAGVVRRFRSTLAVYLMVIAGVLVAMQVLEAQRVRLTAAMAWHQANALVGQLQFSVNR